MGILFQIAVRNLVQAARRTLLLGSALAAVTLLLVLLLSLSQGITDNMIRSATAMSTGHVNVAGFFKMSTGQSAPIVSDASKVRAIVEKAVPDAIHINDRHRGWGKLISDTGSLQAGFAGVSVGQEPLLEEVVQLAEEREYKDGGRAEVTFEAPERAITPGQAAVFYAGTRVLGGGWIERPAAPVPAP